MKLLVTGGCGFIGSAVVCRALARTDHRIVNLDWLTRVAVPESLQRRTDRTRLVHEAIDICARGAVRRVFAQHRPDAVLHLAAESHVDRSINNPDLFVRTNVLGTQSLLAAACDYWSGLSREAARRFRFVQVSTDEVFGARPAEETATEATGYAPRSPYAASKAAADQIAWSYHHTYGLPLIVTHSCNNYGPWQHPDKLVPVTAMNALERRPIPLYGNGDQVRDWIHVDDHARALLRVLEAGTPGMSYAISADEERSNLELVWRICARIDALVPDPENRPAFELARFVADRPGHDHRYGLTSGRIRSELDWAPRVDFETGIARTVEWYRDHLDWCRMRTAPPASGTGPPAV